MNVLNSDPTSSEKLHKKNVNSSFLLEASFLIDPKVINLRLSAPTDIEGFAYIAIYLSVVGYLRMNNYKVRKDSLRQLAFYLRTEEALLKTVIDFCIAEDLFQVVDKLWITCRALVQRMERYEEIRQLKVKAGKASGEKRKNQATEKIREMPEHMFNSVQTHVEHNVNTPNKYIYISNNNINDLKEGNDLIPTKKDDLKELQRAREAEGAKKIREYVYLDDFQKEMAHKKFLEWGFEPRYLKEAADILDRYYQKHPDRIPADSSGVYRDLTSSWLRRELNEVKASDLKVEKEKLATARQRAFNGEKTPYPRHTPSPLTKSEKNTLSGLLTPGLIKGIPK